MVGSLLAQVHKYDICLRWACNSFKGAIARWIECTICPLNATAVRKITHSLHGEKNNLQQI